MGGLSESWDLQGTERRPVPVPVPLGRRARALSSCSSAHMIIGRPNLQNFRCPLQPATSALRLGHEGFATASEGDS